ncbi:helix-turn-helix domain-containing protein [Gorillibacterium sp. sgz5001074]|uniref:helix-turn-helix domain-containing protein n=1 Tax=Gorillibacterium sp. sgz5001074 TaxID=3446695 RepID=UPI003F67C4CE
MSDLGQLLKKARLDRGISLEDLQETTKIRKKYLECIETGNYNALPGNFYVRAFIKSYAEAVGLDPNEVLQLYRNDIPDVTPEPVTETIAPKRTVSKRSDKWSRFATGVMLVSFFLLIVGLIYYFAYKNYNGEGKTVQEDQTAPITKRVASDTPAPPAPLETKQAVKAAAETPKPVVPELKFLKNEKGIDYYEITQAEKLTVAMRLTGADCWFQIDKVTPKGELFTHEMIEQGSLAKLGSPKTWESDKPVYLNIGLPTAVELTVNGVAIPLGELSNPKRVQIQAAGKLQ